MLRGMLEKMFGNYSEKEVKRLQPIVNEIEAFGVKIKPLSDHELQAKTDEFKQRLQKGETLNDILPEAYAVVREASERVLGMRHFPVQLMGGIVLHQGRIAEMKTGEGKTLVATLPSYLNALTGNGVHVVTVNEYLARRDSEWMGKIHRFLGLTVGLVMHDMNHVDRQAAYNADITYATNNELGFDYLRDNMVIYKEEMVQRGQAYAIVDEVDSILIDEARTPLIISGQGDKSTDLYKHADHFVRKLKGHRIIESNDKEHDDDVDADYIVDEKAKSVTLTAAGMKKSEQAFGVENWSDPENAELSHHINQALKAHGTMALDCEYVVKDGQVIIVDEFTGRLMFGRRYSDGLHQAIEAKEGVKVERESKTLATITFQNYFRMYEKLSGMTGTAQTEEMEFREIYKLDVVIVPTNRDMVRKDLPDLVFKNETGKFNAVIEEIAKYNEKGAPVLVGTVTIEKSEQLSALLKKRGVPHVVLNAKFHEKEAEIVAQAGKKGAVTIATNMAGRGTDIVLGGNAEYMSKHEMKKSGYTDEMLVEATGYADTDDAEILEARRVYAQYYEKFKALTAKEHEEVISVGGLQIIGTERHESRRIDNQLRGRAGRQGDPGTSRFYISLQDDLMRLFGSERITGVVNALGLEEDQPIEHRMLSGAIETAQKRVEGRNFDIRKHVLQYDDVMNEQRKLIYGQRQKVLSGEDLKPVVMNSMDLLFNKMVATQTGVSQFPEEWDLDGLRHEAEEIFLPKGALQYKPEDIDDLTKEYLEDDLKELAVAQYDEKEQSVGSEIMREVERVIMLRNVDTKWMDHIDGMDQLRQGIGLRAFAQRDPVVEFKFEGYDMFEEMVQNIQHDTVRDLFRTHITTEAPEREQVAKPTIATHGEEEEKRPVVKGEKIGRNDPCPCGSGKKYKKCHGE
ncbi:MAG: preprotein translocase subunit SecA [Hyphomonadaceae bacterium]|nr:preprotein translocase subunit SecA [Clostridia bacterium]